MGIGLAEYVLIEGDENTNTHNLTVYFIHRLKGMAASSLGVGMANQVTLTDNYSDSQSRVISYPALPSNPTWASVARISLPAWGVYSGLFGPLF